MKQTITRSLVELKTLDDRINYKIQSSLFVGVTTSSIPVPGYSTNKEAEKDFKSNLESIQNLIKRRYRVKSEIVKSNAVTIVTVCGGKMTVAEAIERKGSIKIERSLLRELKSQLERSVSRSEQINENTQATVDSIASVLAGKNAKLKDEDIKTVQKIADESHKTVIVDPNKLRGVIDKMEDYITEFTSDIDIVLSESNTRTEIDV